MFYNLDVVAAAAVAVAAGAAVAAVAAVEVDLNNPLFYNLDVRDENVECFKTWISHIVEWMLSFWVHFLVQLFTATTV